MTSVLAGSIVVVAIGAISGGLVAVVVELVSVAAGHGW